jgi:hypothetical protein
MISFIQLPYRGVQRGRAGGEIGPRGTALILALVVCFQVGLLLWFLLRDWGRLRRPAASDFREAFGECGSKLPHSKRFAILNVSRMRFGARRGSSGSLTSHA